MRWILLTAVLLAALPASQASASPDPDNGFGVNVQSLVRSGGKFGPSQISGLLSQMTGDGLKVARTDALWAYVESSGPDERGHRYDWSATDQLAGELAAAGARWDAILHGSPSWASTVPRSLFAAPTPEHYGDFAAYAGAFAGRYGDNGSFWREHPELPNLPVDTIEIWNEPNTEVHWGGTPSPAAYASLYSQSRAAIKAADSTAQVLVGGIVWNDDAAYLQGVLGTLGPGAQLDGVASHPYAPTVYSIVPNVQRMRYVLDRNGYPQVPLMLNELGWPAAYDRAPSQFASQGPVSDAARAATMALTVDTLARSTCNIGGIDVYDLVEAEDQPQFIESLMGIYRRDGARTQTSAALADAVSRYRALGGKLGPLVPACGARGATQTQLLGLGLTGVQQAATGCITAKVAYRGLPLEEAQVYALRPYSGVKPSAADGSATLCPPKPVGKLPTRMVAIVQGVAKSNLIECVVGHPCRAIGAAAACAVTNAKVFGSRKPVNVAARGLAFKARGCTPQEGGLVRLRATLLVTKLSAKALKLKRRTIGTGSVLIAPGAAKTLRVKIAAKATRRALRKAKRVGMTVQVRAVEDKTVDKATRTVVVRR